MKKKIKFIIYILGLSIGFAVVWLGPLYWENKVLTCPIDIPLGPQDVKAPGGKRLPIMIGSAGKNYPSISMVNENVLPGESLIITGHNLEWSKLRIWSEGGIQTIEPLRTMGNRAQAVLPDNTPNSTMLIWPIKAGKIGTPIRVNGATLWWCWPARLTVEDAKTQQVVQVMGKNLKINNINPSLYLKGPNNSQWLNIKNSSPYCIEASLPEGLQPGEHYIWAHNGTGGKFGWSEMGKFDVIKQNIKNKLKKFHVDDFGAKSNDDKEDSFAILSAIDSAAKDGGGIIVFSPGIYYISKTINVLNSVPKGFHFIGAGKCNIVSDEQEISGKGTIISSFNESKFQDCLFAIKSPNCSIRDMTLYREHTGVIRKIHDRFASQHPLLKVTEKDVKIERVGFVMPDGRPKVPNGKRKSLKIYDSTLQIVAPGKANILVRKCDFHSAGSGIQIGSLSLGHMEDGIPVPSTDYVLIEKCLFRGYSCGFYKEPKGLKPI